MRFFDNPNSTAGKVTVSLVVATVTILAVLFSFDFTHKQIVERVEAQANATTTVTVINTPPSWTVDATESPESSTSSPTNATSTVTWTGQGTDPNAQDYFLIICKTSAAPTPNNGAPPSCNGGASNMWGISATTSSGVTATATYATLVSDAELNDWWASICDADSFNAACNSDIQQGTGDAGSPFHVNHRPRFTLLDVSPSGGSDPGSTVTWESTSSDPDTIAGDTVKIFICKTADFDYSTVECSGGWSNTWASSTLAASDVSTSTTIAIPTQDGSYTSYAFVTDDHGFAALDNGSPTSTAFTVNNVAPTVSASSIYLNYGNDITLSTVGGETTGYKVTFIVSDNNSCVANGSTTSEFSDAIVSVFRSGVLSVGCDESGEFNTNSCYTTAATSGMWMYTAPVASSTIDNCTGPTDTTQGYEFTFPLWFNADPTDGSVASDSTWYNEDWLATVAPIDDNNATGTTATTTHNVELISFLASNLTTPSISYGSIAPGGTTSPLTASTTLEAVGNVGLDEDLTGKDMCTNFTLPTGCSYFGATSTIPAAQQVYATSSIAYNLATALSSTTNDFFDLSVQKTTSTSTLAAGDTTWGIAIPIQITLSGVYTGQNTITAVKGNAQQW